MPFSIFITIITFLHFIITIHIAIQKQRVSLREACYSKKKGVKKCKKWSSRTQNPPMKYGKTNHLLVYIENQEEIL